MYNRQDIAFGIITTILLFNLQFSQVLIFVNVIIWHSQQIPVSQNVTVKRRKNENHTQVIWELIRNRKQMWTLYCVIWSHFPLKQNNSWSLRFIFAWISFAGPYRTVNLAIFRQQMKFCMQNAKTFLDILHCVTMCWLLQTYLCMFRSVIIIQTGCRWSPYLHFVQVNETWGR